MIIHLGQGYHDYNIVLFTVVTVIYECPTLYVAIGGLNVALDQMYCK